MKSSLNSQAEKMLSSAELYRTQPRLAILKALLNAKKPLTQGQIARQLGKNRLNKVTIYRTLESFCKASLVHKAYLHKRAWHFELANHCGKTRCHPHFTCKACGLTKCLLGHLTPLVKGIKKGFVVHQQQVRLEGLCPACSSKARRAS